MSKVKIDNSAFTLTMPDNPKCSEEMPCTTSQSL